MSEGGEDSHEDPWAWLHTIDTRARPDYRSFHIVAGVLPVLGEPFTNLLTQGMVKLDGATMSKSKGNVIVPTDILDRFGSDAVRWRAAMARPGMDSPFDETQMKVGRRLAMKILNASKFILGIAADTPARTLPTEPVDLAMLASLAKVVEQATAAFEAYDYSAALEAAERFFWQFCDDYLELVKERAYAGEDNPGSDSARAALREALVVLLRLFAPFLPFVTEEVWSWWRQGSIHRSAWPKTSDLAAAGGDPALLEDVATALVGIRGAKSQAKVSMKTEATRAVFAGPGEVLNRLLAAEDDLRSVGRITSPIVWDPIERPLVVTVDLKPAAEPAK